ncbi:hypothetical protein LCGC14_0336670 [marine sediment metagenome]|uniref:Uncharacterized protein n=1 Tax=marine sediment metagenome TaxID=412755 RepID=A0A0F9TXZ6_9ZZZZ
MTDGPKIKAIAPWFGSKRNLAPLIVDAIGNHRVYWEPFCGSMAVLLAKPPCKMETVNDLHGDLVNLASVIQHEKYGPGLHRRLSQTLASEELFWESVTVVRASEPCPVLDIDRAYHYFVVSWLGLNGMAGRDGLRGDAFCVRFTATGGQTAVRWVNVVESIAAWRTRLRNVTILRRDGFGIISKIADAPRTAIYVDPPYIVKGARSNYKHDFDTADHQRLADALGRFQHARVVVSYYDHPDLDRLYPGWTRRTKEVSKAMAHQGKRGKNNTKAVEVLLINQPKLPLFQEPNL